MPSMEFSTAILLQESQVYKGSLSFLSSLSPHRDHRPPRRRATPFTKLLPLISPWPCWSSAPLPLVRPRRSFPEPLLLAKVASFCLAAAGPRSSSAKPRCPRICWPSVYWSSVAAAGRPRQQHCRSRPRRRHSTRSLHGPSLLCVLLSVHCVVGDETK
ncbi:hypothetical protein Scep_009848 [Stephania cephalantha]|uniref:Uncharacterized protein n=1 Tax=Stephania cephalantha TaxID=152367 RepID=A0AAP0PDI4_9MAGN